MISAQQKQLLAVPAGDGDGGTPVAIPFFFEVMLMSQNDVVRPSVIRIATGEIGTSLNVSKTNPLPTDDWRLAIPNGDRPGLSVVEQFGETPGIDNDPTFFTVWDRSEAYVVPTQARIHDVASTDINDAGTLVASGTASAGSSLTQLVDTSKDFVSLGVSQGDILMNDTRLDFGIVASVSTTTLTVIAMRDPRTNGLFGDPIQEGDSYRVASSSLSGAAIVFILGLNASFLDEGEFVILNGTTAVPTTKSYRRQYRMRAFDVQGGGSSVQGTITSTAQTDGTITCEINGNRNQSEMAVYSVPVDKMGFLIQWWAVMSKKQTAVSAVRLRRGFLDGYGYSVQTASISASANPHFQHTFPVYNEIPDGLDLWIDANSDTNGTVISAGFDLILKDLPS